ncbi:Endo-14-beta-xylanase 2 [Pyrenophora seminiperda CCB06]|uniref:Beta-xylanase n=1 Tax=Pyrenophora seminiperda CCB06 TaxID=1302712 RepID=A0A3M7LY61_9PLEO|nr:Endo-14-beta-xylanase 2 [Pyrenophora seminiperda CCB06]
MYPLSFKMRFSAIVTGLAFASSAIASPTYGTDHGKDNDSLYKSMKKAGRSFIGTALTLRNETREGEIIKADFNSFTPENAMKFESLHPSRNNYTFDDADRYAAYAKKNNLQIHCHNLVWHSQLPQWVSNGGFDNKTLISIMEDHIKTVMTRYKSVCTRWDVVNEALNEDGTYRESVWYNTIGEAYLPIAFRFANKYRAKADLFYNDYNLEYNADKTKGAARIVKLIKSYGVRIDGVGYQAHLASEPTPTSPGAAPDQKTLEAALHATADLGVDVVYTELDLRMNTPSTPAKLQVQADAFERVAKSCIAVKRCIGITVWGISDKYSWIPGKVSAKFQFTTRTLALIAMELPFGQSCAPPTKSESSSTYNEDSTLLQPQAHLWSNLSETPGQDVHALLEMSSTQHQQGIDNPDLDGQRHSRSSKPDTNMIDNHVARANADGPLLYSNPKVQKLSDKAEHGNKPNEPRANAQHAVADNQAFGQH